MTLRTPRRAQRRSVTLPARYRTSTGLRDRGHIFDISPQGCCMRMERVLFSVGAHVLIRPDGLESLGGTVRWIKRDFAGIEFDRAIYPPVVDHLVQIHHAGSEVALVGD